MMTEIKVRKIGNSLGLLLPKETAQELDVAEGESLYLCRAPEGRFYLTPYDPEFDKQMAIAKKGMRRYRNTLRELAK
jgi:putative addiction module antidote